MMSNTPWQIALFALIPAGAALVGGGCSAFLSVQTRLIRWIEHFVAGIVIGAVCIELLPQILGHASPWSIALGFACGAVAMILLSVLSHLLGKVTSAGLIGAGIVDLFIDGLLIGIAFIAGATSGLLIACSLSFCALFLSLSIGTTLRHRSVGSGLIVFTTVFLALALPIGAFVGADLVARLPETLLIETLAFGVAALLYLGVEELLGEAHKRAETPWIASAFFLGFLGILLFRI